MSVQDTFGAGTKDNVTEESGTGFFINREDREIWESIKNDVADLLHLKLELLKENGRQKLPPPETNTPSSSSVLTYKPELKALENSPAYRHLWQKIRKVSRRQRRQEKIANDAKDKLAKQIKNHQGSPAELEELQVRDLDVSLRLITVESQIKDTWSIPDDVQQNEEVQRWLKDWRETQGGRGLPLFDGKPIPDDDMVTEAGDY